MFALCLILGVAAILVSFAVQAAIAWPSLALILALAGLAYLVCRAGLAYLVCRAGREEGSRRGAPPPKLPRDPKVRSLECHLREQKPADGPENEQEHSDTPARPRWPKSFGAFQFQVPSPPKESLLMHGSISLLRDENKYRLQGRLLSWETLVLCSRIFFTFPHKAAFDLTRKKWGGGEVELMIDLFNLIWRPPHLLKMPKPAFISYHARSVHALRLLCCEPLALGVKQRGRVYTLGVDWYSEAGEAEAAAGFVPGDARSLDSILRLLHRRCAGQPAAAAPGGLPAELEACRLDLWLVGTMLAMEAAR